MDQLRGPARAHLQAKLDLAVLQAEANQLKVTREQQTLRRTAETHALNRKNVLETLTNKLQEIEEQIAQCQIFAPNDGVIQHIDGALAQGIPLRARQTLFSLVNVDKLVVTAFVDERMIRRIKPGDAFTNAAGGGFGGGGGGFGGGFFSIPGARSRGPL